MTIEYHARKEVRACPDDNNQNVQDVVITEANKDE